MKKVKWYLILILAVTALVAAGSYLTARLNDTPVYKTKATLAVVPGAGEAVYGNLSVAINQGRAFAELLNSPVMRKTVLSHLSLENFDGAITAAMLPDTNLLELEVTDVSPGAAYLMINGLLEEHGSLTRQVIGDVSFAVLQVPQVPVVPENASPAVERAVCNAGLAALILAILCAWHFLAHNPIPRGDVRADLDIAILVAEIGNGAKRHWKLGLLLVMACTMAAAMWSWMRYQPMYEASVSFTVRLTDPETGEMADYDAKTAEKLAKIFPGIMASDVLQSVIRENLVLTELPEIRMEVGNASKIMTLCVANPDPEWAYEVLTAVLACYPEVAEYVVGPTQLLILDSSGVPEAPKVSLDLLDGVKSGVLIGFVLWIVMAAVLALMKQMLPKEKQHMFRIQVEE